MVCAYYNNNSMRLRTARYFLLIASSVCVLCGADTPEDNQKQVDGLTEKKDVSDTKPKRQNGVGEEVDLAGIPNVGQGATPSQPNPQQPFGPQQPGQPGQSPFFGINPYFSQQQPFYNGFGYPQGYQPQSYQPQGYQPQGYPQGFPQQGYPQFSFPGRTVILQNNGKQYLVQPLGTNQRIVQKNGKQYLLQAIPGENHPSPYTNANAAGLPVYNVPNAAITSLPGGLFSPALQNNVGFVPNAALTAGGPLFTANPGSSSAPALTSIQPNVLPGSDKIASFSVPQRIVLGNGKRFEVEQVPIQSISGSSPYLPQAVGAVAGQLASQARQYAQFAPRHYLPYPPTGPGLTSAYARANQAGYGLYAADSEKDNIRKRASS